ncbi:MAG: GNAT family N-acetyltransferase [Rhodoglobus sp.]
MKIELRDVLPADQDRLFEFWCDPESVRMAAFTHEHQNDRGDFDAHQARLLRSHDVNQRAITVDGELVGTIGSFVMEGDTEVTYWIDRAHWGRGVATAALSLLLAQVPVRPLFAGAASDNVASLRVLHKAGFVDVGAEVGFANGRGQEITETRLRLDA